MHSFIYYKTKLRAFCCYKEGTGDAVGLALDNPINEARYYAYNEAASCSGA
jgi:hypothetical protein